MDEETVYVFVFWCIPAFAVSGSRFITHDVHSLVCWRVCQVILCPIITINVKSNAVARDIHQSHAAPQYQVVSQKRK